MTHVKTFEEIFTELEAGVTVAAPRCVVAKWIEDFDQEYSKRLAAIIADVEAWPSGSALYASLCEKKLVKPEMFKKNALTSHRSKNCVCYVKRG